MATTDAVSSSPLDPRGAPGERRWPRHLLLWLLGGWFFLSINMAFIASANFRVLDAEGLREADRIYAEIPAGEERRRDLRYAASEINRYLFSVYSAVHVVVAAAAFALLWLVPLSARRRLWIAAALGVCLVFAIVFVAWFTPVMVELGREIDFLARDPAPPPVQRFFRLHQVNVAMEMIKLALLAAVAVALIRR
jgi:hypothetical protein